MDMAEPWYSSMMGFSGILILTGIFLTWMVRRKIERVTGEGGRYSVLLLAGGVVTAVGFAWSLLGDEGPNGWMLFLILTGPALIGYALFEFGFTGISGRLLIQSALMLLSLFGAGHYSSVPIDVAYTGPFLAVLLLMNSQIIVTEGTRRDLLVLASWLMVIFSWTRYLLDDTAGVAKAAIVLLYFFAAVIWVAVLVSLYLSVSADYLPLPKGGQEGL
ncbi:hypothetical protein A3L11_09210 [Thermococcus siculi]|uniref:DUF981 domain-containing protein n=1 Tax=Thermococcus siculi TaxID=72803 RepID=A0A2Z2MRT4_9EURY|nr:hypothetical protein [Thermococcus siculi]ASJ09397.1 hypothetical protein A3L11_09210 [Thermococcus siculi]